MKKLINWKAILWVALLVLIVAAILLSMNKAYGATPKDFGLTEGTLIRAVGDNDIFIINEYGFKRLFLNPAIFNMYGHLGGWANVKSVTPATRDDFVTSPYYRADGDTKVWKLEVTGDDTGILHWVNLTQDQFLATVNANSIFTINGTELAWYGKGEEVAGTGAYSVGLAGDNLSAQTILANSQAFPLLSVDFKGSGTVNSLTVKKLGFAESEIYENVRLLKDGVMVGDVKTLGTSTGTAIFNGLNLRAPFNLKVVADMAGSASQVAQIELQGDVSGLPIKGSQFNLASITNGTLTISKEDASSSVISGQVLAKLGKFSFYATPDKEDITLNSVVLENIGNADVSNLKMVTDSKTIVAVSLGDRKYQFNNIGLVIQDGKTKKVELVGDVVDQDANTGETVRLSIRHNYDVYASSNVYGFGVKTSGVVATITTTVSGENGTLTASSISGDKIVALWGSSDKTLFQFKAKAKDETLNITDLSFKTDGDVFKRIYVYQGTTLVGAEDVDGSTATISSNFNLTGEQTFTVKADLIDQDTNVSKAFTPALVSIKTTGVSSDIDKTWATPINGFEVLVYSAYPTIVRTDNFASTMPLTNIDVAKFTVTAIGGDVKLASASAAFNFGVSSYGMPNTVAYKVLVDGVEYATGDWASTSVNFSPLLAKDSEEVTIIQGASKEVLIRFNFAGADGNRGFRLNLPDSAGVINWFAKDKDGDYKSLSSSAGTLTLKGIDFTQFYRETN